MKPETTIVIADDHDIVRHGLRSFFEGERRMRVIGEAEDGPAAIRLVDTLRPDILILDMVMTGMTGLEVIHHIRRDARETRAVVFSMYANEAYVALALKAGAMGYVLKGSPVTHLREAVRRATEGQPYLGPPLSADAVDAYLAKVRAETLDLYDTLTAREREVLRLTSEGLTSAEIASQLFISPRTAEAHRANLMRKLGIRTQAELVRYALWRGIIPIEQ